MSKSIASKILWLVPLAWAPGACSTNGPVDIGHDGAELSDYAASWDGYGEVASFPESGSDRVRLDPPRERRRNAGARRHPAVAAANAGRGRLPHRHRRGWKGRDATDAFRDGFKYPVYEARVEAGRIRFGIDPLDLYGAWCALVPPVPNELRPSGYACGAISGARNYDGLDDCAFQFATSDPMEPYVLVPVDCGIFELCSGGGPCTCTASACGPNVIPSDGSSLDNYPVVVDAAIDPAGTMLTGTLAIKDGVNTQRITIRMQRAP